MRLNQDVASIFCNGHKDPYIFCNGVQVWPRKVITSHGIYLDFESGVTDNMTFQGLWWNGSQITESMVAEASYKSGNTWNSISASDLRDMLSTSSGKGIYCSAVFLKIDSITFNQFKWRTQQYYAPQHKVTIKVQENSTTGVKYVGEKEVTQAANTTFTVNRGDTI